MGIKDSDELVNKLQQSFARLMGRMTVEPNPLLSICQSQHIL